MLNAAEVTTDILMTEKFETNGQGSQAIFDGERSSTISTPADYQETRRQSVRCAANGIVVLTDFEEPVVTNIYDISLGGVSFWIPNGAMLTGQKINMDILVYDTQANFEYLISHVEGRVRSRESVSLPFSNGLVRRFGIEFFAFGSLSRTTLMTCYNMVFDRCLDRRQQP